MPEVCIEDIQKILNKLKIGDCNGKLLEENGVMGEETKMSIERLQYIVQKYPQELMEKEMWIIIEKIFDKPILKIGTDKHSETRYLQWRLGIYIDGIFGNNTKNAVMKYQRENNLDIDGVVKKEMWKKLGI